jgi:hypothetical protein
VLLLSKGHVGGPIKSPSFIGAFFNVWLFWSGEKGALKVSAMNSFTSMGHNFQLICMYIRLGLIEVTVIIAIILWTKTCSSRACDPNKGPMKQPCMRCIACQSVHVKMFEYPGLATQICLSFPSCLVVIIRLGLRHQARKLSAEDHMSWAEEEAVEKLRRRAVCTGTLMSPAKGKEQPSMCQRLLPMFEPW